MSNSTRQSSQRINRQLLLLRKYFLQSHRPIEYPKDEFDDVIYGFLSLMNKHASHGEVADHLFLYYRDDFGMPISRSQSETIASEIMAILVEESKLDPRDGGV